MSQPHLQSQSLPANIYPPLLSDQLKIKVASIERRMGDRESSHSSAKIRKSRWLTSTHSYFAALNPESMMGPLISAPQLTKSIDIVKHSLEEDSLKVECGGERMSGPSALDGFDLGQGYFFPPTILSGPGVTKSRLWREEVFGPVICVASFAVSGQRLLPVRRCGR